MAINSWVFTDPHYNHRKLVEGGYRPEGYEAKIQASWVAKVQRDDTVYCLGDVCMAKEAEAHDMYIRPMPGRKILIRGNHDKHKDAWYLSHGWDEIHETLRMLTTVNGRRTRLLLSHIPQADDGSFDLNLHGHLHNDCHRAETPEMKAILCQKHRLLALERTDYQLVTLLDSLTAIAHPDLDRKHQPGLDRTERE